MKSSTGGDPPEPFDSNGQYAAWIATVYGGLLFQERLPHAAGRAHVHALADHLGVPYRSAREMVRDAYHSLVESVGDLPEEGAPPAPRNRFLDDRFYCVEHCAVISRALEERLGLGEQQVDWSHAGEMRRIRYHLERVSEILKRYGYEV